ncbi:MAG: hypothetical protein K2X71_18955 [Methylobacterium sp.]|uniref:hypothetical protein n=1 Tax=Methylobacterium sp. TaxID=409 RepID=UPI0025866134|nr:hypothetical protein [Methylobacterium sp.]MBY0298081.1 hypothetical protein [Methylobacterium sp.]
MSADLREVMRFSARRGPTGRLWFDGERNGRRFAIFECKDGTWSLYERVGHPAPDQDVQPSRRPAPRRIRRELAGLGLIEAGDVIEQAGKFEEREAGQPAKPNGVAP